MEQRYQANKIDDKERTRLLSELPGSAINPPKMVKSVARFITCLEAMHKFFNPPLPPIIRMRSKKIYFIVYDFLDASGTGFGSTLTKENGISYRMGVWGRDQESESSNWREFNNVVESLEEECKSGALDGSLIVLAVDNSTVESCLYKRSKRKY